MKRRYRPLRQLRRAWPVLLLIAGAVRAEPVITPLDAAGLGEVLAAQRGQVVLVNFWATWCRPCLDEIPELTRLAAENHERGLRLVPVSLDDADGIDAVVRPFLRRFFPDLATYASLERDMDRMVSVVDPGWNQVLPTSYVLDREGRVVASLQGGKSAAEFAAAVAPLLE